MTTLSDDDVRRLRSEIRTVLTRHKVEVGSDDDLDTILTVLQRGPQLTPIEADLHRVPSTGLERMIELAANTEQANLLKKLEGHVNVIRQIAKYAEVAVNKKAWKDAIHDVAYASRTTVQAFNIRPQDPDDEETEPMTAPALMQAINKLYEDGAIPTSERHRPVLSHVDKMSDGRVLFVYSGMTQGEPVLGPDRRVQQPAKLQTTAVIVDTAAGTVEVRGSTDNVKRVAEQFAEDLSTVEPEFGIFPMKLNPSHANALKDYLRADLRRETWDPADEATTGVGSTAVAMSRKYKKGKDLANAPGYKTLPGDRAKTQWRLVFAVDGSPQEYSVLFNWKEGRLCFQHGAVDNAVIQHVITAIKAVERVDRKKS